MTEPEVQQIMFRTPVGNEVGLEGYWTFDEGVNDYNVYDWSANGYLNRPKNKRDREP